MAVERKARVVKSKLKPGRWVRVRYIDVGVRDGLIIDRDDYGLKLLEDGEIQKVEFGQVVALGPEQVVPEF